MSDNLVDLWRTGMKATLIIKVCARYYYGHIHCFEGSLDRLAPDWLVIKVGVVVRGFSEEKSGFVKAIFRTCI